MLEKFATNVPGGLHRKGDLRCLHGLVANEVPHGSSDGVSKIEDVEGEDQAFAKRPLDELPEQTDAGKVSTQIPSELPWGKIVDVKFGNSDPALRDDIVVWRRNQSEPTRDQHLSDPRQEDTDMNGGTCSMISKAVTRSKVPCKPGSLRTSHS